MAIFRTLQGDRKGSLHRAINLVSKEVVKIIRSITDVLRFGRYRNERTAENIATVREMVAVKPNLPIAWNVLSNGAYFTPHSKRILHLDLQLHSCKVQLMKQLQTADHLQCQCD